MYVGPFEKIYKAIAKMRGIEPNAFRLVLDGHRVNANETPKMLEMENEDCLDFRMEQQGGAEDDEEEEEVKDTAKCLIKV